MSHSIQIGNKFIDAPASWNELTADQLITVAECFGYELHNEDEENREGLKYVSKIRILRAFLNIGWYKFTKLTPDQQIDLFEILDFLYKTDYQIQRTIIKRFSHNGRLYYGPSDKNMNSSFYEMTKADTYYVKYMKERDEKYLDLMIAYLYRPGKWLLRFRKMTYSYDGDPRRKLIDNSAIRRAKRFTKLDRRLKLALLYQYTGFSNWMRGLFENIFPEEEETHLEKSGNDYGWAGVMLEMSGDVFGNLEQTSDTPWFTVFVRLSQEKDKEQELKRKYPDMYK